MKLSNLAVFYLWTNIYTVNTGLLTKPFISIYQHKHSPNLPALWSRLLDAYLNGSVRGRYSAKSPFSKQTKGKRFFEFSPLAFERQTFRQPGDKPFRIFDVKRFFQYSPFISRLQRSHAHIKPKFESPKSNFRPYIYKPVVDHFSGFQRWTPLSKSISTDKLASPTKDWNDNQNQLSDILEDKENSHDDDFRTVEQDNIFDNTKQSMVNSEAENVLKDAMKMSSEESNILTSLNNGVHPKEDGSKIALSTNLNDWRSTTEPKQNLGNSFIELDALDKLENGIGKTINRKQHNDDKINSAFVWQGKDLHTTDIEPDPFVIKNTFNNKPAFDHKNDVAQTKDSPPIASWGDTFVKGTQILDDISNSQSNGFWPVQSFGSSESPDTIPSGSSRFGFGHRIHDSSVLHNTGRKHSQGVWGPFKDDTIRPQPTFDSIPVPPLPSTVNDDVSSFLFNPLLFRFILFGISHVGHLRNIIELNVS